MAIIRTTLGENLQTKSVLEGKKEAVQTALLDPREHMNPGELLAASLGACMMSMVGFMASKRGEKLEGTEVAVSPSFDEKHTRIVRVEITFSFPSSVTAEQKDFYAKAAQGCPVHNSLREDIAYVVNVK